MNATPFNSFVVKGMGVRTARILTSNGVTPWNIQSYSYQDLRDIRGLGRTRLNEIKHYCNLNGITLSAKGISASSVVRDGLTRAKGFILDAVSVAMDREGQLKLEDAGSYRQFLAALDNAIYYIRKAKKNHPGPIMS